MTINEMLAQRHVSLILWAKNNGFEGKDITLIKKLGAGKLKGVTKGRTREIRRALERDFPYLREQRELEWKTA